MKEPETSERKTEGQFAGAHGSATVVELSGNETDEQCKDIAWQMFCNAHPVEAYQHNPDGFWTYFHARAPDMTREQMVALLKECEEPEKTRQSWPLVVSRQDPARTAPFR